MITIKSGRHPLAVSLLGFLALSGLSGLVTYSRSASGTIRSLPNPLGVVFYVVLFAGSAIAIVGVFTRGLLGPLLERSGLCMLSGLLPCYAILAIARTGWPAMFVASILLGLAVGCVWRIVQIGREMKLVRVGAARVGAMDELGGRRERWRAAGHRHRGGRSPGDDRGADLHPPAASETDRRGQQDPS
jgi:hypothetical protein